MDKQKSKICCICGKIATNYHKSISGQIIFDVCKMHYLNTSPAMGFCNEFRDLRSGLVNKKGKFIDLKYYGIE